MSKEEKKVTDIFKEKAEGQPREDLDIDIQAPAFQDIMSRDELNTYLTFILTKQVKDEDHAIELRKLSRRVITLSDAIVVARVMTQRQEGTITTLMNALQIQQRVLEKLGATPDDFLAAKEQYEEELKEMQEEVEKKNKEEKEKQEEKPSDDAEV